MTDITIPTDIIGKISIKKNSNNIIIIKIINISNNFLSLKYKHIKAIEDNENKIENLKSFGIYNIDTKNITIFKKIREYTTIFGYLIIFLNLS